MSELICAHCGKPCAGGCGAYDSAPPKPAPMYADVRAFHAKFGLLLFDRPGHLDPAKARERMECLLEELNELGDAFAANDLAGQADALVDLIYFALGTAAMLGLPFDQHWAEVQRANMAKVRGVGHRNHRVDCVKPAGWQPPNHDGILARAGYAPDEWVEATGLGEVATLVAPGRTDPPEAT